MIPNPNGTSWVFPCVYTILTQKDNPTYTESFDALVALRNFALETMMVNYVLALWNTLGASFPSASVDGCFFHFCQAVVKNVNRLGYKRTTRGPLQIPPLGWNPTLLPYLGQTVDDASLHSCWMICPTQHRWHPGLFSDYLDRGTVYRTESSRKRQVSSSHMELLRHDSCPAQPNHQFRGGVEEEVRWSCHGHSHHTIWNFLAAVHIE